MITNQPRYTKEEFARRGDEMYERVVQPQLQESDKGRFVALDIETGAYEMDDDLLVACDRLKTRLQNAEVWMVRVGSRYVHRFGGHSLPL